MMVRRMVTPNSNTNDSTFWDFITDKIKSKQQYVIGATYCCAAVRFNSHKGQLEYVLVHVVRSQEGYTAYPIGKGSGSMTTFSQADGFLKIPTNQEMLAKDEAVQVHLLSRDLRLADVTIIGSHCVGLDYLVNCLKRQGIQGKIINVGSTAGLQAARRGEADIAGIHLLDEQTGEYNRPFVQTGRWPGAGPRLCASPGAHLSSRR